MSETPMRTHRIVSRILIACGLAASGTACDSIFTDLRPDDERGAPDAAVDAGLDSGQGALVDGGAGAPDAAVFDALTPDAGGGAPDAGTSEPDAGAPVPDAGTSLPDAVLARGTFEGRTGYNASGEVQLRRRDGALEVVFGDNFDSQSVPGPVVILSRRDSLGNTIDPDAGDIELDVLRANTGAQTYSVPPEGADANYAWIYCRPFLVEVARSELLPVSS